MNRIQQLILAFRIPLIVLLGIFLFIFLRIINQNTLSLFVVFPTIALGSYSLIKETVEDLLRKHFALDYIAILAIIVSVSTQQYLVAAVIAFMLTSGRTLEEYGVEKAKASLTSLIDRIPSDVIVWKNETTSEKAKIGTVLVGQKILIRRGEVIPLDGKLVSENGLIDESSLTGEPYMIDKIKNDEIRSGTLNSGDAIIIEVTKREKDSTYKKIVDMVKAAQSEKAPLVRLADKYSMYFTVLTLLIAAFAYLTSHDVNRILSVLVIATPCPLILATPIALLGGVNAAARKRIIVKRLASIEVLSRIQAIIFDKTGTITLGKPKVSEFKLHTKSYSQNELLAIAESVERNSLHPLAKAVVNFAKEKKAPILHATGVKEIIGSGISGNVDKKTYTLAKLKATDGMQIGISEGKTLLAVFTFEDEIKQEAKNIIKGLREQGLALYIFTGDKKQSAQQVVKTLGEDVIIQAECTPEDKKVGIEKLKREGKTTAMIGDGINDAPALALADVGLVFSNEEQTAASEAADIVILGGDFGSVYDALTISKKTIKIALTSIFLGIGLSIFGMLFASVGLIPPIIGAVIQEAIDIVAIVNSLRTSRLS